jgi:peptide deformylase
MRLKIVTAGEPVLRAAARELSVDEILSPDVQRLIEMMRETVRDAPGVGLAAPQVGEGLRLAVIEDKVEYHKAMTEAELKERGRKPVPFHVLVNPVMQLVEAETARFFEGCLSVPGFGATVPRAQQVRVRCLDHHGEERLIAASGWYARILQHEIDHLAGTLYIDRMDAATFSTVENYGRHWKDQRK